MRIWVCERLQLEEEDWFSERTILRWVHRIGFKIHTMGKSIYVDGHEREDVVQSRQQFLQDYEDLYKLCWQLDDENLQEKLNPDAKFMLVSQDEKVFHSNDVQTR